MTDHGDQLREAFADPRAPGSRPGRGLRPGAGAGPHVPAPARGPQAAGGAVLGAGLIAGAISLPGLLAGEQRRRRSATAAAPAARRPAPSVERRRREAAGLEAYFDAGYDYDDAVQLAKLWKKDDQRRRSRPRPGGACWPVETCRFAASPSPVEDRDPERRPELDAFFAAGYGYDDAVKLAKLWKHARRRATRRSRPASGCWRGRSCRSSRPRRRRRAAPRGAERVERVLQRRIRLRRRGEAGQDLEDRPDPYDGARSRAGKRLLAGKKLPIKP